MRNRESSVTIFISFLPAILILRVLRGNFKLPPKKSGDYLESAEAHVGRLTLEQADATGLEKETDFPACMNGG